MTDQVNNNGCVGLQKAVETYIVAIFDARNASHNLMVELYECEKNPELAKKIEDKIPIYDADAQAVADVFPCIFKTKDPQVREFLEIMGVIS